MIEIQLGHESASACIAFLQLVGTSHLDCSVWTQDCLLYMDISFTRLHVLCLAPHTLLSMLWYPLQVIVMFWSSKIHAAFDDVCAFYGSVYKHAWLKPHSHLFQQSVNALCRPAHAIIYTSVTYRQNCLCNHSLTSI